MASANIMVLNHAVVTLLKSQGFFSSNSLCQIISVCFQTCKFLYNDRSKKRNHANMMSLRIMTKTTSKAVSQKKAY